MLLLHLIIFFTFVSFLPDDCFKIWSLSICGVSFYSLVVTIQEISEPQVVQPAVGDPASAGGLD